MNKVIVVYAAGADEQCELNVEVPVGATLREAIHLSGILSRYPEINLEKSAVGVFSKRAKLEDAVNAGDRVEIYRPLLIDPKEARRARGKR
ncbi:MAG TPA: RnfH family protein [Gammaproteobacteria bacterium]|nr:RnfH family protein [Gammaproteobacteria bacterium]